MESRLIISDIGKSFNRRKLFKGISADLCTGRSLAVTGPNGSGKSTFLEIAAGLRRPDKGSIELLINGSPVKREDYLKHAGFCSPRVFPYDNLTGYENILFSMKQKDRTVAADSLFERFVLTAHKDKPVRHYSTGMRQRLKFIIALINDAPVLFLDEPGSNLDETGRDAMYSMIRELRKDRLILIATNEPEERNLCDEVIRLG